MTRVLPDGPRHDDGSLAFVPGVCVYLPPGYETSGLRYPTVYLLHGGGGDQGDWVTQGSVQSILDDAYAADPANAVIAVMPDGRSGQWHDWFHGEFLIERYVLDHVVPFIDARFRTIADRGGRAIAGLSNGGYGAFHFAAKAPDLFVAAGAMSAQPRRPHVLAPRHAGGRRRARAPRGWRVLLRQRPGHPRPEPRPRRPHHRLGCDVLERRRPSTPARTWAFEQSFRLDNQHFRDELDAQGYTGTYEYRETEGAHAWRWWSIWLRERHLPFFLARLTDPEPADAPPVASPIPATFRYRSIAESFDVFGYEVHVDRDVREFLDLLEVTRGPTRRPRLRLRAPSPPRRGTSPAPPISSTAPRSTADDDGRLSLRRRPRPVAHRGAVQPRRPPRRAAARLLGRANGHLDIDVATCHIYMS